MNVKQEHELEVFRSEVPAVILERITAIVEESYESGFHAGWSAREGARVTNLYKPPRHTGV